MYTIIAHGRVFILDSNTGYRYQMDIATAVKRTILPKQNQIIIPSGSKYALLVAAIFGALVSIAVMFFIIKWRNEKIIKFSQPLFLVLLCLCSAVTCLGTLTLGFFDLTDEICNSQPWVTTFTVVWMYSFLLAKTLRVMAILNNKKLKKKTVGTREVIYWSTAITFVYILILGINVIINPQNVTMAYGSTDVVNYRMVCAGDPGLDSIFSYLKIGYCIVVLLAGVTISKLTSNFVTLFNESAHIQFAIQNICFVCLLVLPTSAAVQYEPAPVYFLFAIGLITTAVVTLLAIMVLYKYLYPFELYCNSIASIF